jgi:hypothetical protein
MWGRRLETFLFTLAEARVNKKVETDMESFSQILKS